MVMLSMMLVMTVQVTGGCDGDDDCKKENNHHLWPYLRICFWAPPMETSVAPHAGGSRH